MSILFEDKPPEGYILNDEARSEMERIAKAGHMNPGFVIPEPTFFGIRNEQPDPSVQRNLRSTPTTPFVSAYSDHGSFSSVHSSSGPYDSSFAGSSRSVDSNISHCSHCHCRNIR